MDIWQQIRDAFLSSWHAFLEHVPGILLGLIVLILAFTISRWLASTFQRRFMKRMDDPLLSGFITKILRFVLVLLGILLAFHIMGLTGIAGGLLAGAGIGALIIGLAFQEIGANFLAGIILAFNRPFNVGDTIEIGGTMGRVLTLNLRNTHIKTFDGKDVYIPNNKIVKDEVINYTRDGLLRQKFALGIDYNSDVNRASAVIMDTLLANERVLRSAGQEPLVLVKEFAASTINLEILFWMETFDYKRSVLEERSIIMTRVLQNLIAAGVEMPSDIIELKHYKGKGFPVKMLQQKDQK